jgi:serine/threonine protein kinase
MPDMVHSALPPAEDLKLVLLADIARGGMGTVQLCRVASGRLNGRFVAVKRLNPAIEQEPEFVNMFLDETWITATINSPHVVKVEAWGRDDLGLYLAVELVQGVSLSRLMKESKEMKEPFAERTVAFIMSQICAGLAGAHGLRAESGQLLGVVHRDLTPGNILVGFDGIVKIADFGIAKAEERLTSTRIGMMKGKPAYMAPEQARGGGIDLRADLFAMGVVMFELLADRRPWNAKNDLETLIAVSSQEPPDLLEIRKVSQVFADIVKRCLKKPPKDRFGSAAEVKELLDGWRRERGFVEDDPASLGAFVARNTPQQQAWFQQALAGGHKLGGVTFSDLEARIDASRKKTSGPQKAPASLSTPLPAPPAAAHAPPPPPTTELEEIDENAQTRFMGSSPAANLPRLNGPTSGHPMAGTVALSPTESARLGAVIAGPSVPKPGDLPLPPARQVAGGSAALAHGPSSSPAASGPAASVPRSSGTMQAVQAPASGPVASGAPISPHPYSPAPGSYPSPVSAPPPSPVMPQGGYPPPPLLPVTVWDPPKRKRSAWRWLGPLLVVLLAGGAAAYWYVLRPRYGI